MSDKAFRKSANNEFFAIGNVVISHSNNAIYGEKAYFSFVTGDVEIQGNVRYVGPDHTIYGSKIFYNIKNELMNIDNARIMSSGFIVIGKEIKKTSDKTYVGIEAEYTTCRDCPESWSIFGKKVEITLGEYIKIEHAYLKVKGAIVMYLPYVVFPIKKERESGLLFPKLGVNLEEGVRFQQPYFWAINNSTDFTFEPSIWGKRANGGEIQFRKSFGFDNWIEVNSLSAFDRIYEPGKITLDDTGKKQYRTQSELEMHFNKGEFFNAHFSGLVVNDLDIKEDYQESIDREYLSSTVPNFSFLELQSHKYHFLVESHFNRNLIFNDPKGFDHAHVQILPRLSLRKIPSEFLGSKYRILQNLKFGSDLSLINFKQNHQEELTFKRNAVRTDFSPYLDWSLGYLGPIYLNSNAKLDMQYYRFNDESDKYFTKQGLQLTQEASVSFEKVFGLASFEEVKSSKKEEEYEYEKLLKNDDLISSIPKFETKLNQQSYTITRSSYKHKQDFKLRHYLLTQQKTKGSQAFQNQISDISGNGQFDSIDTLRGQEFTIEDSTNKTSLPLNNTVEFVWNQNLIKKSPKTGANLDDMSNYLTQKYSYTEVLRFNVSQGYNLNIESDDINEKLTRLYLDSFFTYDKLSFNLKEYYFYNTYKHIFTLDTYASYSRGETGINLNLDGVSVQKTLTFYTLFNVSDLLGFRFAVFRDLEIKKSTGSEYGVIYSPANNCWKFDLKYVRSITSDDRISFNFLINYNSNSFTSLSAVN